MLRNNGAEMQAKNLKKKRNGVKLTPGLTVFETGEAK